MRLTTIITLLFLLNASVHCIRPLPFNEVARLESCLKQSNVEIITRENPKYADFNDNFNIRIITNPKGFLVPANALDVQYIVHCGRHLMLKLTPKCGGHSFEKYSFGTDKHWVIDLRNINYVNVDKNNGIAAVGAGLNVYDMAQKLIPNGYILSTGTCLSVGVSGFTLGGGYGYLVRTFGLMIDRVLQMKMVTANSKLITVSPRSHPNLFWALRGAGANSFGVVTEFTFNLIPLPEVITIIKFYDLNRYPEIFGIWSKWAESEPNDAITPSIYFNYPVSQQIMFFAIIRSSDSSTNDLVLQDVISRFPDITKDDFIYQSYNESLNTVGYYIPKNYFKAVNYYVSKRMSEQERVNFANAALELCEYCYVLIDMDGGSVRQRSNAAFIHRKAFYDVMVVLGVPASLGDEQARQIGESSLWYLNRFLYQTKSLDNGHSYQNYVDNNRSDWRQRYFGMDYSRLWFTNALYDPSNFFTCPQCI